MAFPKELRPPRLSIGAELEFAVYYTIQAQDSFASTSPLHIFDDGLPEPLTVKPPTEEDIVWDMEAYGQRQVEKSIRETLKSAGFPCELTSDALQNVIVKEANRPTLSEDRLGPFRDWEVGIDRSMKGRPPKPAEWDGPQIRVARIEVATPVEWDSPDSFEVVRYAVNLLASLYRIELNPSMGLHVHVGNGSAWMPYHWVKRIGMLFWAAERLLSTLNPPSRSYCFHCPTVREFSNLARNEHRLFKVPHDDPETTTFAFRRREAICGRYLAKDVRPGESSVTWREMHKDSTTVFEFEASREPGIFGPFYDNDAPYTADEEFRPEEDARVPLDEYAERPAPADTASSSGRSSPQPIDDTIFPAPMLTQAQLARRVAKLKVVEDDLGIRKRLNGLPRIVLPQRTRKEMEELSHIPADYTNAHLDFDYMAEEDPGVWFGVEQMAKAEASCELAFMLKTQYRSTYNFTAYECGQHGNAMGNSKRTIEWRQAAGSMNADWVTTWMRIAAGVSRFAVYAPVGELQRLLRCCDFAEKGGSYDILDFLEDVGLVAEAQIAGKRIQEYGGPDGWGLKHEGEL